MEQAVTDFFASRGIPGRYWCDQEDWDFASFNPEPYDKDAPYHEIAGDLASYLNRRFYPHRSMWYDSTFDDLLYRLAA